MPNSISSPPRWAEWHLDRSRSSEGRVVRPGEASTTLNPEVGGYGTTLLLLLCTNHYSPCVDTAYLALAHAAAQKHTADEVRRGEARLAALEAQSPRGAV